MRRILKTQESRFIAGLVAVILVVVLTAGAGRLPFLRMDVSGQQVMTMDAKAVETVRALEKDIEIYYLATDDGKELWVDELVQKYDRLSGRIAYQMIPPTGGKAGDLSEKVGYVIAENSLVVVSGDRAIAIPAEKLYNVVYNEMYYYYYGEMIAESQSFVADQELVNAILYVTREDLPIIYALTGHGESELIGMSLSQIQGSNIVLQRLSLKDAVPEDAAAVLINGPTSDLTDGETEALLSYLKNGGNLILTTGYMLEELPNLKAVTAYYGMEPVKGLVLEMTSGYCYSAEYPQYITPDVLTHATTAALAEAKVRTVVSLAGAIERNSVRRAGLNVTELMTTSETAYVKPNMMASTIEQEETDISGKYTLSMAAEEGDTRVFWVSGASFLSDNDISISNGYNLYVLDGVLKWMTAVSERVAIEDGNLLASVLTLPQGGQMTLIYAALFVPALIMLIIGAVRKGRKKA